LKKKEPKWSPKESQKGPLVFTPKKKYQEEGEEFIERLVLPVVKTKNVKVNRKEKIGAPPLL